MKCVLLVEDHALFRESLAEIVKRCEGFEKPAQAGSLAEGRDRMMVLDDAVDIAVIDLSLPDGDGTDLIRKLREEQLDVPVLVLAESEDSQRHARVLEAGAERVFTKDTSIEEIIDTIRHLATSNDSMRL